jgi:hypothetical protein
MKMPNFASKLKALNLKFRKGLIELLTLNLFLSLHTLRKKYVVAQ